MIKNRLIKWNVVGLVSSVAITAVSVAIIMFVLERRYFGVGNGSFRLLGQMTDPVQKAYSLRLLFASLTVFLISLFISALIIYRKMNDNIIKPLDKLTECVKEMTEGDYDFNANLPEGQDFRDIWEYLRILQATINDKHERLKAQERKSQDMLSSISHDLRTPVTTILGYSEGIIDNVADTDEKKRAYALKIKNKAIDLNNLIDELLAYASNDNSSAYHFEKTDIISILEEIKAGYDTSNSGIDITITNEAENTAVNIDRAKMKRVISNIIGNAVKYSSQAPPKMDIHLRNAVNAVVICFSDNGIGIAPDKLPHVFERFYRCDDSRNDAGKSYGLGLSIAKVIVEGLKGKIWAKSEVGVGTRIYVSLPTAGKE